MVKHIIFSILFSLSFNLSAQICNIDSLITRQVRARTTDSNISWELNRHHAFYNPTCTHKNTLLVHLVGSFDNPSSTLQFPSLAANNGFHVVSLKYPTGTSAQGACDNSSDPACYLKFRREVIEGVDFSSHVTVDSSHSINNRLIKLLQYLNQTSPNQGWNTYFSGNDILWGELIISGHSQGGGHAAVIAMSKPIKRVLMFASPNDFSSFFNAPAPWTNAAHAAADAAYYGLNNTRDDVVSFSEQFEIWHNLGMPALGDSVDVLHTNPPYHNSHQLYTSYDTTGLGGNHSTMVLDSKTPVNASGKPLFEPAWKYMLGIQAGSTAIEEQLSDSKLMSIYPKPTADNLFIKFHFQPKKGHSILVYDMLGRQQMSFDNINQDEIQLNTTGLETGIYFVKLKCSDKIIYVNKIILK